MVGLCFIQKPHWWGTQVALSVMHLTLNFGSGHDPQHHEIQPWVGLMGMEPAQDSLFLLLPCLFPSPLACVRSSLILSLIKKGSKTPWKRQQIENRSERGRHTWSLGPFSGRENSGERMMEKADKWGLYMPVGLKATLQSEWNRTTYPRIILSTVPGAHRSQQGLGWSKNLHKDLSLLLSIYSWLPSLADSVR